MGLLDSFFNPNDPQSMGLLSAASQILQQSGNTRQPYGLGQAMGTGIQGYMQGSQQARANKQQEEEEAQRQQMRAMQMQQAQQQAAQLKRTMDEQERLKGFYAPQGGAPGGMQQPTQGQPTGQQGSPQGGNSLFDQMMTEAQQLKQAGFIPQAEAKFKEALSVRPKFAQDARTVTGPDGKPMLIQMADDGTARPIQGGYGAAEKLHFADNGQRIDGLDQYTGAVKSSLAKQQTPDSIASGRTQMAVQNAITARQNQGGDPSGMLPAETVAMMAQQYRAGDTSVMQNLGRGMQGSQNIIALRNEIAKQTASEGKGGADLAARNAEYFGTKAGQRTAGTRIANVEMASTEAQSLIPLARDASEAVARSGLLPFGKAQIMFDNQTNDPALRQFAAANNALVNVYSRAISPSGVPTVADKEHAREMISTAMDNKSYQAVLNQMEKEITAARAAPKSVRQAFSDSVTGRGDHGEQAKPAAKPAPAAPVMDTKPTPNAGNSGRVLVEHDTGKRYRSNGLQWVEIK